MGWNKIKIKDFLKRSKIPIDIEDSINYKRVTIRINHNGVSLRDIEHGKKIGTKKQFILKHGQFILSKIDARYGAFGIAPPEVDGAIITGNFWAYDVNKEIININWLNQYTNSPIFYDLCERASSGITHRKYLDEGFFLNHELSLPDISEQDAHVELIVKKKSLFNYSTNEFTNQLGLLQKLRQQILQDAVQGKLVPQDHDDVPASKLLERIKAEKEKLIKEGKIKRGKPLPEIRPEEIPFEIPENWVWCRLGEIIKTISTGPFGTMLHKSDYVNKGIPLINPMNIVDNLIIPSDKMMINTTTKERLKNYVVRADDIVIGRRGEMGRCAVVTEKEDGWICGTGSFFLRLMRNVNPYYLTKILNSNYAKKYLLSSSVGSTMDNLNHRILINMPIPLPSRKMQKIIVSKIEQLMKLFDELEQSIRKNQEYSQELLQVALKEALEQK